MFSKILDPASPHRENILVWAHMDILCNVDNVLFGEHSEQCNTHLEYMCGLDWCFTHQNEFLPQFEEVIEHTWKKALKKEDLALSDRGYLYWLIGHFCEWLLPSEVYEDSNGKQISTTAIPRSLKYGNLLVGNPDSYHHFGHFLFDTSTPSTALH